MTTNTTDSNEQQGGALEPTWRSDKAHEAICEAAERIANRYCDEDDTYYPEVRRLTVEISKIVDGSRASLAAVEGDERCEVSYTGRHRIDAPYCKDCGRVFTPPCECTDHDPRVCLNGEVDEGSRYCHCGCHAPAEPRQEGEQENV